MRTPRTQFLAGQSSQDGGRETGDRRGKAGLFSDRLFVFALPVLLAGCFFGRSPDTRYYTLDYVPVPTPERLERGPFPFTVRLREPTIAEAYRRSQIVYRQSAYQMQFYSYNLWAVDPERMIGDLLFKHLRAARLFENVTRVAETLSPDFQITCDVRAIEEYDSPDRWYAHLAVEYQLIDEKNGQVLWKQLYDLRKAVPQQEPVYVVRELAALIALAHERLVEEIEPVLREALERRAAIADTTRPRR